MLAALQNFAQDYSYYTYSSPSTTKGGLSTFMVVYLVAVLIVAVVAIVSMWKVFTKAGKPGWAAIVPIYNYLVLLEIVGRPWWWILLMLVGVIPFVGWIVSLVVAVIVLNDLSKSFGQGTGMTVLLVLLPFIGYPILAFGDAKYHGPAALNSAGGAGGAAPTHPGGAAPQA
jgi:hypothetical protein